MVNCKAAGCAPPDVLREMFKVALPPGVALPELTEMVACCAIAKFAATMHSSKTAWSAGRLPYESCVFMMPLVMNN
jgi:hypothetical protein